MSENEGRIDYVEFPARDLEKTKWFFREVFGWKFEDYGSSYTSFSDGRLAGGFFRSDTAILNGALVVLYSSNLEQTERSILSAGGKITKTTFTFPGGRRFHFSDPSGNELAVWSDR